MRRPDRQPARARPERHDPHGLLGRPASQDGLTPYQREALGFGRKAIWPATEAFNRANLRTDYPIDDAAGRRGRPTSTGSTRRRRDADAAARRFWQRSSLVSPGRDPQPNRSRASRSSTTCRRRAPSSRRARRGRGRGRRIAAARRLEDERYRLFAEAVGRVPGPARRGLPRLRGRRPSCSATRARTIRRPSTCSAGRSPASSRSGSTSRSAIGGHVDHQLMREVGIALLDEAAGWVMPGPDWAGTVAFYEDFPYAWWDGLQPPDRPAARRARSDPGRRLASCPEYADISDQIERKITGLTLYASQIDRLFGGDQADGPTVRSAACGSPRSAACPATPSATGHRSACSRAKRRPRRTA